jgi:hypothetical protein
MFVKNILDGTGIYLPRRNNSGQAKRSKPRFICPSVNPSKFSESSGARQRKNVPATTS